MGLNGTAIDRADLDAMLVVLAELRNAGVVQSASTTRITSRSAWSLAVPLRPTTRPSSSSPRWLSYVVSPTQCERRCACRAPRDIMIAMWSTSTARHTDVSCLRSHVWPSPKPRSPGRGSWLALTRSCESSAHVSANGADAPESSLLLSAMGSIPFSSLLCLPPAAALALVRRSISGISTVAPEMQ